MTSPEFPRSELVAAFGKFEETVARAAQTHDWDAWVQHYTPDVDYIEHAMGTMKGRDQVRDWIRADDDDLPGQPHGGVPVVMVGH